MTAGCCVCSDNQGSEENSLVYCDGCDIAVHQACYGIGRVPEGSWFCTKCESGEPRNKIKCHLCPSIEGALKRTDCGYWAHVVCALYIPEVRFGNNRTMEPIEIRHIKSDRYNKSCYLCKERKEYSTATTGAVIDCHKNGCKQSFHVTCAQSAELLCEEAGKATDNLIYCGYCKHHFRKLKTDKQLTGMSNSNNKKTSATTNQSGNLQANSKGANNSDNFLLGTIKSTCLESVSDSSQDNINLNCNTTNSTKTTSSSSSSSSSSSTTSTASSEQDKSNLNPSATTSIPNLSTNTSISTINSSSISNNGNINAANDSSDLATSGTSISDTLHSSTNGEKTEAQPTVPPLKIPVPKVVSSENSPKSAAKPKQNPRSSKKKPPEGKLTSLESREKESKPKTSRSRKSSSVNNNDVPGSTAGAGATATSTPTTTNNSLLTAASTTTLNTKTTKSESGSQSKPAKVPASSKSLSTTTVSVLSNAESSSNNPQQAANSNPATNKRKSRSSSNESGNVTSGQPKRSRKKKTETPSQQNGAAPPVTNQSPMGLITTGLPNTTLGPPPLAINTPSINNRYISGLNPMDSQDMMNRYYSPMLSPYTMNYDLSAAPGLSRSSISRLFASSAPESSAQGGPDEPERLLEELRENTWTHLSKCILDQAQQFDIPSLIGILYTLRNENDKLSNRVRDLTMKRDQLLAINARLDLPGPLLTQHMSSTSPNFNSVMNTLTNSPKNMPGPPPGSSLNKQSLISIGPYNHMSPAPPYLDRGSPMMGQAHSAMNSMKSTISTPSPPIGAIMAHNNAIRSGLSGQINQQYVPNVYPSVSNQNSTDDFRQHPPKGSGWTR